MATEEKMEIYFVRHADVVGGATDDRDPCDRELTELGKQEIELLGDRFADVRFDAYFSSPLVRCVHTASAVLNRYPEHPVLEIMPEMVEKSTPVGYLGQDLDYLSRYYDNLTLCKDVIYGGPDHIFDKDSKIDCLRRMDAVIEYLRNRFGYGKRVIVFSHACIGNNFLQSAMDLHDEDLTQFRMTMFNTSVSKVKFTSDGVRRVSFSNDISHLRPLFPHYELDM